MKVLIILGMIVLALLLLSLIRLGAQVEYGQGGVLVRAKLGVLRFTVYPRKPQKSKKPKKAKKDKAGRKKKQKKKQEGPEKSKKGGGLPPVQRFLPLAADAAGRLKRKIRIDTLYLDFTAAGEDPAKAAMAFGKANAFIGMIWPLFEQNFNVKDRRIRTAVDFQAKAPAVYVFAAVTLTVGQVVSLVVRLLIRFLKIYFQHRAEVKADTLKTKQKEAV